MLEEEKGKREAELTEKMEEIKSMFAAIVLEKAQAERNVEKAERGFEKGGERRREELSNANTVNFNTSKSAGRKESVDDAYRQMFMKTLHRKKENKGP